MRSFYFAAAMGLAVVYVSCQTDAGKPGNADTVKSGAAGNTVDSGKPGDAATPSISGSVERGHYLVDVIGCGDCHTPKKMTAAGPVPDMSRYLSGYNAGVPLGKYDTGLANGGSWVLFKGDLTAAAGPWGVTFSANLTPDGTGLGGWTADNFRRAIKEGKYKGLADARPLLPPMPSDNLAKLSDEDVMSIYAYLKTIKPVRNLVPAAILNPPPGGH